jgi:hypothetical protein
MSIWVGLWEGFRPVFFGIIQLKSVFFKSLCCLNLSRLISEGSTLLEIAARRRGRTTLRRRRGGFFPAACDDVVGVGG